MNVGCRIVHLPDGLAAGGTAGGDPFPVLVLYPTREPESPQQFGPYTIHAARDAAPAPTLPTLIVISHGSGGSHLVYRDLATHLARCGFLVAIPKHPRNNRDDNSLAGTAENLAARPRHIRAVLDWAQKPHAVLIGHSMGGYTALALAGGRPTCFPNESPDGLAHAIDVPSDPRVTKLVLLAPATAWFLAPGALADVRLPILLLTAGADPHTPAGHAEILKAGAPHAAITHRVVAGAGHFSFLSPFPQHMTSPAFPPSQDPPGFDRAAFQQELQRDVLAFLSEELSSPA